MLPNLDGIFLSIPQALNAGNWARMQRVVLSVYLFDGNFLANIFSFFPPTRGAGIV
jgi:hypothetical protein